MVVKHNYLKENFEYLERDYWRDIGARKNDIKHMTATLDPSEVGWVKDTHYDSCRLTKKHKDGWTIHGEVIDNGYYYVDEFYAHHKKYGHVKGSFSDIVTADSEEAYRHFIKHHKPTYWDLCGI